MPQRQRLPLEYRQIRVGVVSRERSATVPRVLVLRTSPTLWLFSTLRIGFVRPSFGVGLLFTLSVECVLPLFGVRLVDHLTNVYQVAGDAR